MRVYFLSEIPCAFFAGGAYLGIVDGFERSAELSPSDGIFCECKATGRMSMSFRFDEDFLFSPPEQIEMYFHCGEVAVRLHAMPYADPTMRVVWQTRLNGLLLTLCVQGTVVLNMQDGNSFYQIPLPFAFENCRAETAGEHILLEGKGMFALIDQNGKIRILSDGRITERGDAVTAEVPLHDALAHRMRCRYEGGKMTDCTVLSAQEPTQATVALALLESVLAGFDPTPYLAPALAPKAGLLREYLGEFRAVVPLGADRVGLVCPRKPRVFDVRDFRFTLEDGKVSNLAPV